MVVAIPPMTHKAARCLPPGENSGLAPGCHGSDATGATARRRTHLTEWLDRVGVPVGQPENRSVVEMFVRAAACAERQDEGGEVLRGLRPRIDPVGYACALASMSLLDGNLETARGCADGLSTMPEATRAYLNMRVAIAEREEDLEALLERMLERERRDPSSPVSRDYAYARKRVGSRRRPRRSEQGPGS